MNVNLLKRLEQAARRKRELAIVNLHFLERFKTSEHSRELRKLLVCVITFKDKLLFRAHGHKFIEPQQVAPILKLSHVQKVTVLGIFILTELDMVWLIDHLNVFIFWVLHGHLHVGVPSQLLNLLEIEKEIFDYQKPFQTFMQGLDLQCFQIYRSGQETTDAAQKGVLVRVLHNSFHEAKVGQVMRIVVCELMDELSPVRLELDVDARDIGKLIRVACEYLQHGPRDIQTVKLQHLAFL